MPFQLMPVSRWAALTLTCLLAGSNGSQAQTPGLADGFSVSYKSPAAPPLDLVALDGTRYQLSAMKGRVVVINFWATWCPPCSEELPTREKLWNNNRSVGLEVLAVNLGDPSERLQALLKGLTPELMFRMLIAAQGESCHAWGVRAEPWT